MFTVGSGLLIGLLLAGLIKYRNYDQYYMYVVKVLILFSVYIEIGYFANIGGYQMEYVEFLTVVALLLGIPLVKNKKIPSSTIQILICLLVSVLLGYLILANSSYAEQVLPVGGSWDNVVFGSESLKDPVFSSSHVLRFIRIFLFLVLYVVLDKFLLQDKEKSDEIKRFIVKSALVMSFICLVEQITKFLGSTVFLDTATMIFGTTGSQVTINFERGGTFALQGLSLEPGSLASSFIPAVFILLTSSLFTEKQRFYSLTLFLYVIFMSGSFAGFALCGLFITMYLFSNKRFVLRKMFLVGVPTIFIGVYLLSNPTNSQLFNYYYDRAFSFVQGTAGVTNSGTARMLSINSAMDIFYNHPLLGVGFGTTDVFGFIPTLLVSVGLIGATLWFVVMLKGFSSTQISHKALLLCTIILFFFIGSLRMIYSVDIILLFLFVFREHKADKINTKLVRSAHFQKLRTQ